jgi:hypothetical protein
MLAASLLREEGLAENEVFLQPVSSSMNPTNKPLLQFDIISASRLNKPRKSLVPPASDLALRDDRGQRSLMTAAGEEILR